MRALVSRYFLCAAFLITSFLTSAWNAHAQDTLDVARVIEILAAGEATELMAWAGDRVELALLGQTRRYSREQAYYVLKAFFHQYPPEGFTLGHSLTQGNEWWLTGLYQVRYDAARMRVYLRLGGKYPTYTLLAIQIIRM